MFLLGVLLVIIVFGAIGGWAGVGKVLSNQLLGFCIVILVIWFLFQVLIVDNL